jgi:replicative DNA helicase
MTIVKIEHQVLNCIWDNPEYIYKFDRPYFISSVASDILSTLKNLYEHKIELSIHNVLTYGGSKNIGITKENLEFLRTQEYSLDEFDFYFLNLKKNYAKLQIEEKNLKEVILQTSSKGELNVEKFQDLVNTMQENLDIIKGKESVLQSIETIGTRYRGVLVDRKLGKYNFSTGDSTLDRSLTTGFAPGQITTIYGSSGVGKSAFALNLFSKQINKQIPTMMITLEMDETATMDRLIANRKKIPARLLQFKDDESKEDSERIFEIFEDGLQELTKYDKFFLVDDPTVKVSDLEVLCKEAMKKMKVSYMVCFIDLATMLSDFGEQAIEMERSMNRLSGIAKRLGIHFVLLVQANRGVDNISIQSIEQLDRLRPKSLHGIKNTAAIGERSRLVLSVFRRKHYAEELFPNDPQLQFMDDILEVTIIKQSSGVTGRIIKYLYEPEIYRIFPYKEIE